MKIGRIWVNGIAQNAAKICQWDLLKLSALKHFTESPMISSFRKAPVQRKAIMETFSNESAQSIVKIYRF